MFRTALALILSFAQVQPQIDPFNLELRIHELINAERAAQKLRPLKIDKRLFEVANVHSKDMFNRKYFDHIDPDGKGPTARGRALGYTCRKISGDYITEGLSENIFQNNLYNRVIFNGDKATYEWNTTEDIAQSCRRDSKVNPNGQLLARAAEAIEYLLEQLADDLEELEDQG